MIEEMRAELAALAAKIERRNKIDAMLQSLEKEEKELSSRERVLKQALSKEEADVDRLQRTTATSVLYSFLGKKDIKLNKEQQEASAAKMKYDAAVRQLDDCLARIDTLKQERHALWDCDDAYDEVYEKLQEQLRHAPAYADRLCALERQRGEAQSQLKELDEAISAGSDVMSQIDRIEESLGNAAGWGTLDILGGGFLSDMAKHTNLDCAQEDAEQLQVLLSRFHTELSDVHINAEMVAINIDGFLRFADFFFDGFFADWAVQNRINESREQVTQVKREVSSALSKLSGLKSARTSEAAAVEKQITELVIQA